MNEHFTQEAINQAVELARQIHEDNDEYETEDQAKARIASERVLRDPNLIQLMNNHETIDEYGAFNDPEFWEPLFASGEIDPSLRFQLDDPLYVSNSMRSAVRYADMRNLERAEQYKVDKYGYVIVRTRTIVRSPWTGVSYDDIAAARGR